MVEINVSDSEGEDESYVVAGAILSCTWGTKRTRLTMPVSHGVYVKDKAQMNIKDFVPNVNIMPFGRCNSLSNPAVIAELEKEAKEKAAEGVSEMSAAGKEKGGPPSFEDGAHVAVPCQPIITMEWLNGKEDTLVEREPALLNISTNACLHCGTITIDDDGQE